MAAGRRRTRPAQCLGRGPLIRDMRPSNPTTWRHRGGLVLFGLVVAALLLAILEGALALLGVAEIERFEDPYVGFEEGSSLFEIRDDGQGKRYVTRRGKLKFFNPQEFPVDKGDDTLRVFTLGGSTTAGRPYDDHVAFSRWLERYLDGAEPSRNHEVINAGAISYASYRIVVLMKELVRYEPDLFVVLTGHNEFLEERTYRDLERRPAGLGALRPALSRLRLSHLVWRAVERREQADKVQLPEEVQTRLDVWQGLAAYERDDTLRRSIVEHFAFNLQQMVDISRRHGVDLIFIRPASNVKDFSPFKSAHGDDLAPAERARFGQLMVEGRERFASADLEGARRALEAARGIDEAYAEVHFRLARVDFELGNIEAADQSFRRAKELDVAPLRSLTPLQDLIRDTAERESVPLIDLPTLLRERNELALGHPILGNEIFLDHVHPDLATHSLIAEQLLDVLVGMGRVQQETTWSDVRRQEIYDAVVADLDPTYYARRDLNLAKVLGWAGKLEEAEPPLRRAAEVLDGEPDLHLNLGILWQKTGRPALAVEQLERAVQLDPTSAEGHFNLGVAYGRLGRFDEGIGALDTAVQLRGNYPEALHNLSVLQRRAGNAAAAITMAQRALDLQPQAAEAHAALALAYRSDGQLDAALEALRESLRLDPESVLRRTDLAVTLAMSGRLEDAIVELDRAATLAPRDADVHYNRGRTLAQLERHDEAFAAYGDALRADPDHVLSLNNLGLAFARRGELEIARQHFTRAFEVDPTYAEALLNLGVVYDMAGRPKAAIRAVEQALQVRPGDPKMHFTLGMLYLANGRPDAARPNFEAAQRGGVTLPPDVAQRLARNGS